jgi:hypothetical protein
LLLRSARAVDRVLGWLAPRVVQAALNPAGEHKVARFGWTFAPGDKVMQMENDYDKEVYNGDIGYIVDVDPEAGEVLSTFDGRSLTYGFDTLVPAYAATIHKSQGSEYPAVIQSPIAEAVLQPDRPTSVAPELMIRTLIVGYCRGIRSERRLCEDVPLNLAHRWFCRHGLDAGSPISRSFSKNRYDRFRESDTLRRLFESVVQRCIAKGLVSADGFAVCASRLRLTTTSSDRFQTVSGSPRDQGNRDPR